MATEAKPINLRNFNVIEGGQITGKSSANLTYKTKVGGRAAYEFQRKQFLALGWKELPGSSVTEDSCSGNFVGAGYKISATVYPFGGPGLVTVMLNNHGNVDFATLPVPPGAKPLGAHALGAMFVTETTVADTIEATRKALLNAGWEAHGGEGGSCYYKQGLNRVLASIQAAPGQGGKTVIDFTGELLVGDLSAPPDAQGVTYTEGRAGLTFRTAAAKDAIVSFYRENLGKTGWKQDETKTMQIDDYDQMSFGSPEGDAMFLKIWQEHGGRRNVELQFLSKEAIAEMNKKFADRTPEEQKKIREMMKDEAGESKAAPAPVASDPAKPTISIAIPAGAMGVQKEAGRIQFTVGKGEAKAVAEGWRKQFKDAGWKEVTATLKPTAGIFAYSKDGETMNSQRVFFNYSDTETGNRPAQMRISAFGANLEQAAESK